MIVIVRGFLSHLTKSSLLLFGHGLPPVGALLLEVGEHDHLVRELAFVLLSTRLQNDREFHKCLKSLRVPTHT